MKQGVDTMKRIKMNRKAFPALVGILSACLASTAYADVLTGSGDHLPHEPPGAPLHDLRDIIYEDPGVDFIGEWTAPALPDWWGTFYATGPVPAGTTRPPGTTTYDFANLALGYLPALTMFRFGDVDSGASMDETFTLNALDPGGSPITGPWLDEPIGVWGTGSAGGDPAETDMPGWAFNDITGEYFIDGTTVSGNPNVAFMLQSNLPIGTLTLDRHSKWANFALAAPVPEPATLALLGLGGLTALRRRR